MRDPDFSVEEQEAQSGFFLRAAQSEFSRIIEEEKRAQRLAKLSYLRSIGRKERLSLGTKHGRRWQENLSA